MSPKYNPETQSHGNRLFPSGKSIYDTPMKTKSLLTANHRLQFGDTCVSAEKAQWVHLDGVLGGNSTERVTVELAL